MRRRRLLACRLAVVAALLLASPGYAAQTSLSDIEDEVMCTICGTTLALSDAPSANRQRAFINELIAAGHDKDEIKDALVAEYGPEVLAVPDSKGFDLIGGWILPAAAVVLAAALVIAAAIRWRRERRPATEPGAELDPELAGPIDAEDDDRLQQDLDRYG